MFISAVDVGFHRFFHCYVLNAMHRLGQTAKPNISAQELNLLQDNDKKVPTKGRSSFEARIRVHG